MADARWWRTRADEIELEVARSGSVEAMRCFTDMRTLLQAATEPPSPPVAAAPATPGAAWEAGFTAGSTYVTAVREWSQSFGTMRQPVAPANPFAQPQPQPAQPLTGADQGGMTIVKALRMGLRAEVWLDGGTGPKACVGICAIQLQGWTHTADTAKAWADAYNRAIDNMRAAHGITAPSTPTPPEVAP